MKSFQDIGLHTAGRSPPFVGVDDYGCVRLYEGVKLRLLEGDEFCERCAGRGGEGKQCDEDAVHLDFPKLGDGLFERLLDAGRIGFVGEARYFLATPENEDSRLADDFVVGKELLVAIEVHADRAHVPVF